MPEFRFRVTHTDAGARRGRMTTAHGVVETPAFMPVGTQGAVKGVTHRDLESAGAEILLSNTYHLYLRPGDDLIARRGGLHRFIGWDKPILTDSGGYQVFSLAAMRRIEEQGAEFRSHIDGSLHLLTPERAVDVQAQLGSDIAMVLDECIGTIPGSDPTASGSDPSRQTAEPGAYHEDLARGYLVSIPLPSGRRFLRPEFPNHVRALRVLLAA